MSGYTTTPNLGLIKPLTGADDDMWGTHWNNNADALDAVLGPSGGLFLPLSGGTVAGRLTVQPSLMTSTAFDAAQYINSTARGSGVNGPGTAQHGLNIYHQKQNYLTTANIGEIDGLYAYVRQGGPASDAGGLLIDVGSAGTGFTAIMEGISTQLAPTTGTTVHAIRAQLGTLNPQSGDYNGLTLQAQNGVSSRALMITDMPGGQGSWTNFLEGWYQGSQNLAITSAGGISALGGLFTGAGQVQVQGYTGVASTAGAYLTWNHGGDGAAWLMCNQGAGNTGGINLAAVNASNVVTNLLAVYPSTGVFFASMPFTFAPTGMKITMPTDLVNAANDGAAASAGVALHQMYVNGSVLMVRVA